MSAVIEQQILDQLTALNASLTTVFANVQLVSDDIHTISAALAPQISKINTIESNISKIENVTFILLIVALIFIVAAFIYWFIRHVWPLITKQHSHDHDFNTVMHDLTSVPVRMDNS